MLTYLLLLCPESSFCLEISRYADAVVRFLEVNEELVKPRLEVRTLPPNNVESVSLISVKDPKRKAAYFRLLMRSGIPFQLIPSSFNVDLLLLVKGSQDILF